MPETKRRFNRVLLKLSGEAIAKKDKDGGVDEIFDPQIIDEITDVISKLVADGIQVGIVIGAGNIWRGAYGKGVKRARADQMGMLGTMINCLRLEDAIEKKGCPVTVMSPVGMNSFAEQYDFRRAISYLESGKVVIFGAGTGSPFFTTDTCAALRAAEIGADIFFKATNVDGVYDKDPNKFADAVKYDVLTQSEVLEKNLKVMDATAASLCRDNKLPILVFNLSDPQNIVRAVAGENVGTIVKED